MIKPDITKAFDSVSWAFLLKVMAHLGFGHRWRQLVCSLLSTSSTQVLLNGQPGPLIRHQQGLRQGDPLSTMLFIITMDVLSSLMFGAEERQLLSPLRSRPAQHRISIYANDVVIFTTPKDQDLLLVKEILRLFGEALGLQANLGKSAAVPIHCSQNEIHTI